MNHYNFTLSTDIAKLRWSRMAISHLKLLTSSGPRMAILYCYMTCSGQDWQFDISTDI